MEALGLSETFITTYQTTNKLNSYRSEKIQILIRFYLCIKIVRLLAGRYEGGGERRP